MKKLLIYIATVIIATPLIAEDARFEQANLLYTDAKYQEAITTYEEILNSGLESGELYFNLGNSYYKSGNLPKSILYYERAKLILPHDKDIQYNLEMANSQITDKLDTIGEFFLSSWLNTFMNSTKSDNWAIISLISFTICVLLIAIFLFSRNRNLKQLSFFIGILILFGSVVAFNFSAKQKQKLTERNTAIIFAPSVTIKSSPSKGGTELFILHEGTKVSILEQVSDWYRIQISDGNEGWAPMQSMEII
jgi:tetratricopeptide (TPR) repeat protein